MTFVPVKRDEILQPSITLVGMAGAGKSTVGNLLAKRLDWGQLDTDRYMESYYGLPLQGIMDRYGLDQFLQIEEKLVSRLNLNRTIISTGGSVIYSQRAMDQLHELGPVVLLDIDEETFIKRVGNAENRGLAIAPGKTMGDLYNERQPLYRAAADITVSTADLSPEESVASIIEQIEFL